MRIVAVVAIIIVLIVASGLLFSSFRRYRYFGCAYQEERPIQAVYLIAAAVLGLILFFALYSGFFMDWEKPFRYLSLLIAGLIALIVPIRRFWYARGLGVFNFILFAVGAAYLIFLIYLLLS